jgi:hypothetical protein
VIDQAGRHHFLACAGSMWPRRSGRAEQLVVG